MSGEELRNAAIIGDTSQVKTLLAGGANPCSVDDHGLTALALAAFNGHIDCVAVILANDRGKNRMGQNSSSINMQSIAGFTALHICATGGSPQAAECCRLLLMCGADRSIVDAEGNLAVDIARDMKDEGLICAQRVAAD